MRVFVTGASGFVGSGVLPELRANGHEVVGLARSDAAAAKVRAAGAEVLRGGLDDLDVLAAGAAAADGVIHLAFIHDFANFSHSAEIDAQAIDSLGTALLGTGKPLLMVSGFAGLNNGRPAVESDVADASAGPRAAGSATAMSFAERGVRPVAVRLAPSVHGQDDHGFIATVAGVARQRGVSGYVGDGSNRWATVHRLDAASLFRLALEGAPAGVVHGVGEEGIATRDIAAAIGRRLGVPAVSIRPEDAAEHFGWVGRFFAADMPASSARTQELLGWTPTHPGLLADIEAGYYTAEPTG